MQRYTYLFGPVPSRRLGSSLGVDLVPFKTCSYDCVFCQLGRTTNKTVTREPYVPTASVVCELASWLRSGANADYITLSGSGEPTLHSEFGDILTFLRGESPVPSALLTNGSLLWDPEVREQASKADVVKVSLSAWDQSSFDQVNRPHSDIGFDAVVNGIRTFRREFSGELWVEVFLVPGKNTDMSEALNIAKIVKTTGPDTVQLNTAVRPACEAYVQPVGQQEMKILSRLFGPSAETLDEYSGGESGESEADQRAILSMLRRRPCTVAQIARAFDIHRNAVVKQIGKLARAGQIEQARRGEDTYYMVPRRA